MKGSEIRAGFLGFFENAGHHIVHSSSLVPADDPTLLFTNAGMNQFKSVFLGHEKRPYKRAASSQKCVRAGGKHNDLENVGLTARHHTFFEMLGNFSFGDYFKKEAIAFAWDYLVNVLNLPKDRLFFTVFGGEGGIPLDEEAEKLWLSMGVPQDRVFRFGLHDNFWSMGDTGPCGPCSEIHFDQGTEVPGSSLPNGDGDRVIEIWNLVFMQYNRGNNGVDAPLPAPSIDTGMGLERLAAVIQGHKSNYDTDLIQPYIRRLSQQVKKPYGEEEKTDISMRIIADHIRAMTFLIADGVIPSNEGRGYVLRKIMRRAIRHGLLLGINQPFLSTLSGIVGDEMGKVYPEIREETEIIRKVIHREETNFEGTLSVCEDKFDELADSLRKKNADTISGSDIFRLYDTFGLPVDLCQEMAVEKNLKLDMNGFNECMEMQREKARKSWKGAVDHDADMMLLSSSGNKPTFFTGYNAISGEGQALAILKENDFVDELKEGEEAFLITDTTPFYAEAGGQVGDSGVITGEHFSGEVVDTTKRPPGIHLHRVKILEGILRKNDTVSLTVDTFKRADTAVNHTATHLLHAVLRDVLGLHVKQAGSLVSPTHLRFDFHHFTSIDEEVLQDIEDRVNDGIRACVDLKTEVMELDEAVKTGAMALFGEKYGSNVRVVEVPGLSKELCGGTHLRNTGQIGIFKIVSSRAIASGIRRIEAITGRGALNRFQNYDSVMKSLSADLNVPDDKILNSISDLLSKLKEMERKSRIIRIDEILLDTKEESKSEQDGLTIITKRVDGISNDEAMEVADKFRQKLKSGIFVIAGERDGKAMLLVSATHDLKERKIDCVSIAKVLAKEIGGGGGGKWDMATAGGKNISTIDNMLKKAPGLITQIMKLKEQ